MGESALFIISSVILWLAFTYAVINLIFIRHRYAIYCIGGLVFLSAVFGFLAIVHAAGNNAELSWWDRVLASLHMSIKLFVVDADYSFVTSTAVSGLAWCRAWYQSHMLALYIVCPLFTLSIVLTVFRHVFSGFRYAFTPRKTTYIFSELNEKTLALAKNLIYKDKEESENRRRQKHRFRLAVFCETYEKEDERYRELMDEAKKINAVFFKKDILKLRFSMPFSLPIYFFLMGEDNDRNMKQVIALGEKYGNRKNTFLYYFSCSSAGGLLMHQFEEKEIQVRRINEKQALIYNELYHNPHKIFDNYYEDEKGIKHISAVVIGLGNYGTEMLQTLTWYCQMEGYQVEINAFDSDPNAESRLRLLCPDVLNPRYNGVEIEGDAYYKVRVHSGVDVVTEEFAKTLQSISHPTYVFVSLGDDDKNINTAILVRMLCERMRVSPYIHAVVYNTKLAKSFSQASNHKGQEYKLDCIGTLDTLYSPPVVINSDIERAALANHATTYEKQLFWRYEYNYNSSVATTIHQKARKYLFKQDGLPEDIRNKLEHRRWNAYMRTQGFVYSGSTDDSSRNDLGKMHNCLVPFGELSAYYVEVDAKISQGTTNSEE